MSRLDESIEKIKLSDMDDETKENSIRKLMNMKELCETFVSHGDLLLTVKVNTIDDAEQLLDWMYLTGEDRPMTADLQQISKDAHVVNEREFELLEHIKEFKFYNN